MSRRPTLDEYEQASVRQLWEMPAPTVEQLRQMPGSIPFALAARALGMRRQAAHDALAQERFGFDGMLVPVSRDQPRNLRCLTSDVLGALRASPLTDHAA